MDVNKEVLINRRLIFAVIGFLIGSIISEYTNYSSNHILKEEIVKLNKQNNITNNSIIELRKEVLDLKNELISSRRNDSNKTSTEDEISKNNLKSLKDTYELYKR